MSRPSCTKTRRTRATFSGSSSCSDRPGRALGLGAGREREGLAEQVQRAVVAADDESGVDEALDRPRPRRAVGSPVSV